jgi:hypothetical protein
MQKVLVNEKGKAWINCEKCRNSTSVDMKEINLTGNIINYKCAKCETEFDVLCEFRKSFRKDVNLEGTFVQQHPRGNNAGKMEVKNISKIGIMIKIQGKSIIKPGYILKVTFILNDTNRTNINQLIEVKWVNGQMMGGEFIQQDMWTKQQLGFYFMS